MAESKSSRSRLTEITIKALTLKASRYDVRDDQNVGLVLRVAPTGRKTWPLSYRNSTGQQQRYTIGTWPNVKLARARQLAVEKLSAVASGRDIQAHDRLW
jgi:hypothetical protein